METVFTIVLLILVILFYLSNPHNKVNKWCGAAAFIFWLGIAKEAVLFNIIPLFDNAESLRAAFKPVYSVCTWALYSLAMPTTIVFALHFCNLENTHPRRLRLLKSVIYIPALVLSFFFPPLEFRAYQLSNLAFWYTYAVYNLSAVAVVALLMTKGVKIEQPGNSKQQKKKVRLLILPPVVFWAMSVFLTHPFQLQGLFKLWQLNAFILSVCVAMFIIAAFRDGFMGLKLSARNYDWDSDMGLVSRSADYTNHMLKNQTSKMELCIEQLMSQYNNGEAPEELAILSRSISSLKNYVDRMKRHSQFVSLLEEPCRLNELLTDAMPVSLAGQSGITVAVDISENVFLVCDKSHMTEVFSNIITNAIEAIRTSGTVEITGEYDKSCYLLQITDSGFGMNDDELKNIFTPFYTTKSTEKNFGLGLSYCKNVIAKHGGSISAKSKPDKGTTIIISIPSKRVAVSGTERTARDV